MLAEVTLLEQLDLTASDIENYKIKYKNNPLLIRKLESISVENGLFVAFDNSKEERLNKILKQMEQALQEYVYPRDTGYESVIEMGANGAIEQIHTNVENYKKM